MRNWNVDFQVGRHSTSTIHNKPTGKSPLQTSWILKTEGSAGSSFTWVQPYLSFDLNQKTRTLPIGYWQKQHHRMTVLKQDQRLGIISNKTSNILLFPPYTQCLRSWECITTQSCCHYFSTDYENLSETLKWLVNLLFKVSINAPLVNKHGIFYEWWQFLEIRVDDIWCWYTGIIFLFLPSM